MKISFNFNNSNETERVFTVMDQAPSNYIVWNIPTDATPGYIPFCTIIHDAENEWRREVNTDTLIAIPCTIEEKEIINKAAAYGCGNLKQAKKYLARKTYNKITHELAKKALPIYERLTIKD